MTIRRDSINRRESLYSKQRCSGTFGSSYVPTSIDGERLLIPRQYQVDVVPNHDGEVSLSHIFISFKLV